MVYKAIQPLKFHSEFVVARKDEKRFKSVHLGKESIFYNDLVSNLFTTRMHVSQASKIYFAVRGNKTSVIRRDSCPLVETITCPRLCLRGRSKAER
jgi:hypothetical protein